MEHRRIIGWVMLGVVIVFVAAGLASGLTIGEILMLPFRWAGLFSEWLSTTFGPWLALLIIASIGVLAKWLLPRR